MKEIFGVANEFVKVAKLKDKINVGRTATNDELKSLRSKFGALIPEWFYSLIKEVPLLKLEVLNQQFEPEEDYDGLLHIQLAEPAHIIDEGYDAYPGLLIREKGYVCIGLDLVGSGDQIFIDFNDSNYPVYQIYHDAGDTAEELLNHGRELISPLFKEFLQEGIKLLNNKSK